MASKITILEKLKLASYYYIDNISNQTPFLKITISTVSPQNKLKSLKVDEGWRMKVLGFCFKTDEQMNGQTDICRVTFITENGTLGFSIHLTPTV